jgi:hypothetical protein
MQHKPGTRASSLEGFNRLGLTPEMTLGALAALAVFGWVHRADLGRPAALGAALDPGSLRTVFASAGKGMSCQFRGIGSLINLAERPTDCGEEMMSELLAHHRGRGGVHGQLAETMAHQAERGMPRRGDGTFSNVAPASVKAAEVRSARCFQTSVYKVGDRGLHSVTEQPAAEATISLPRWLAHSNAVAERVVDASPALRDAALLAYLKTRKSHGEVIHRFFGVPGLTVARTHYDTTSHRAAVTILRERLIDPGFGSGLSPLERAELDLLAADPLEFVSCTARRGLSAQL